MANSHYLKKYVQMHPDNKMGWYLLGKEYEKAGQHGKANYCFNQSGGIFEAFETSKMPSDIWKEYESKLLQQVQDKDRRSVRIRRALIVFMLLLLALVPSVDAPGQSKKAEEVLLNNDPERATAEDQQQNAGNEGSGHAAPDEDLVMFTAAQEGGFGAGGQQIEPGPFTHTQLLQGKLAVLELKKQGKWLMWNREMPLGYTLKNNGPGALAYQSYNPKTCNCQPSDGSNLSGAAFAWTGEQEEQALLYSAIKAYKNNTGGFPEKMSDLLRPFPGNWVSGTTEGMKEAFQPLLQRVKTEAAGQELPDTNEAADGAKGKGPFSKTWGNRPFFEEPLKIVVDKSNHRLAVVSGRIILRNYKVGLGGIRTPEGNYVITDKVMNPNGHSDGEFGSRGMQLSGTNYAIHGTNEPASVGADESQGCVRMSKTDVEELFDMVPMGTPVLISKGALPDEVLVPTERFHTNREQDQTNPQKTYHWL
ncbi:L,D-transpeptidase [Paenibacillus dokdonensis]|uniref:L,D-transpeptidase n=1 Tax=Paenibacillus dokdonensis TaxID=2567944 RepID=UPI0010A93FA4|nr:L,D-transpeptidase [Paenibacillus dokdonensis]